MTLDFGRIVRDLRGDLSQTEFAARLGRTQPCVSYWESGRCMPSLNDLAAMLEAAGCDWPDIFGPGDADSRYHAGFKAGVEAARKAVEGLCPATCQGDEAPANPHAANFREAMERIDKLPPEERSAMDNRRQKGEPR